MRTSSEISIDNYKEKAFQEAFFLSDCLLIGLLTDKFIVVRSGSIKFLESIILLSPFGTLMNA
jgi:hypothetical protein